jgi:hypothetical protein
MILTGKMASLKEMTSLESIGDYFAAKTNMKIYLI